MSNKTYVSKKSNRYLVLGLLLTVVLTICVFQALTVDIKTVEGGAMPVAMALNGIAETGSTFAVSGCNAGLTANLVNSDSILDVWWFWSLLGFIICFICVLWFGLKRRK